MFCDTYSISQSCMCCTSSRVLFPFASTSLLAFLRVLFFLLLLSENLRSSLTVYSLIFILISFGEPQFEAPSQVSLSMLSIELAKGTDTSDAESCVITKITLQTCDSAFHAICVGNGFCRVFAITFASRISEFTELSQSAKWQVIFEEFWNNYNEPVPIQIPAKTMLLREMC